MSIRWMSRVWEHSQQKEGTLLVLLAIADFADDHGVAYPSVAALQRKSRLSERAVQYALRIAEQAGELEVQLQAGPHGCNLYRILPPAAPGATSAPVQSATERGATGCTRTVIDPSVLASGLASWLPVAHVRARARGTR